MCFLPSTSGYGEYFDFVLCRDGVVLSVFSSSYLSMQFVDLASTEARFSVFSLVREDRRIYVWSVVWSHLLFCDFLPELGSGIVSMVSCSATHGSGLGGTSPPTPASLRLIGTSGYGAKLQPCSVDFRKVRLIMIENHGYNECFSSPGLLASHLMGLDDDTRLHSDVPPL